MKNSFLNRLLAIFITVFVALTVLVLYLFSQSTQTFEKQASQQLHQELASHMVAENQLLSNGEIEPKALKHAFHTMMLLGPAFEIYVVDRAGNLLAYSADESKIKRRQIDLAPVRAFIANGRDFPLTGDDPRSHTRQKIFSAAEIHSDQGLEGYLYVIIGGELSDSVYDMMADNQIIQQGVVVILAAFVFALVVALLLVVILTRPLRQLSHEVTRYRQNEGWQGANLHQLQDDYWRVDADHDIARLGGTFKEMALTIGEQFDQVQQIDAQRKELLAYISHDLRTPLASLQGYLETWQIQHREIPPEAGEHYIEVALKNARKLNILVEQVFELAHLENGQVQLTREPVAIAELAQDVVQSFQLKAARRNIKLQISPRDSSLQVDGDIAKLERVLSNLVENAIRHTLDGGEVTIGFKRIRVDNRDQISIAVSDTGIGIPKDELPRVFEAHFRASNKRGEGSRNAGLGLAIVRALLLLHQSEIMVDSEEQKGTTFSFCLPSLS